jgi:hypothetical protein
MWKPGVAVQAAILNALLMMLPGLLYAQEPAVPATPPAEQPAAPAPPPPVPTPELAAPVLENNSPNATAPREMPRFTATDPLKEMEADRLSKERSIRQWAAIQRREFVDGANRLIELRRMLAHTPVGSETPTLAAMKTLIKQADEVRKKIPKIIEYLGGKKSKAASRNAAPWRSSTDAAVDLLSALRRVNPELEAFARNEHQFDAAKSRKLIVELELVQQLLHRLHQSF